MPNDPAMRPRRRHPVHGIKYVEGQPTIIFDTLCLKRRSVFACEKFHRTFLEIARTATAWLMGRYVLMPDHIHFFAGDVGGEIPYENWVKYLKSQLTQRYKPALAIDSDGKAKRNLEGRPATSAG